MKPFLNSRTSDVGRAMARAVDRGPAAVRKRLNLQYFRLLYGTGTFGDGCDIRARCKISLRPGGELHFGPRCIIDSDMTLEVAGRLEVGADTVFGHHCTIATRSSVRIGPYCLVAEMVSIRDHDHNFKSLDEPTIAQGASVAPVVIGRNVWLGAKVTVLRGVTIGDNAVIGAGAVVTRDVPADAVAAGVPARVLRVRTR